MYSAIWDLRAWVFKPLAAGLLVHVPLEANGSRKRIGERGSYNFLPLVSRCNFYLKMNTKQSKRRHRTRPNSVLSCHCSTVSFLSYDTSFLSLAPPFSPRKQCVRDPHVNGSRTRGC